MAGVGFELRKLFKNNGYFSNVKGYFISTIVTTGNSLLCIIMIISAKYLLGYFGESFNNIDIFIAVIVYAFAFSLIITGGFTFFASRYVSDCIYEKKVKEIIPSFLGIITLTLIIIFICGNLFFLKSNLNSLVKITSYIIFAELSVIWIETVYISVLKDYIAIVKVFFIGVAAIFAGMFGIIELFLLSPMMSILFSMDLGFMLIMVLLFIKLFCTFEFTNLSISECFKFLKSMDIYPELFFIGLFYFIGMYSHNFVFWFSGKGTVVENTFYIAPFYDIPVFYKVDTSFHDKYTEYYAMAQGEGSFKDIKEARKDMISTISIELKYLVQIQVFITWVAIVIGKKILFNSGLSMLSRNIFSIVALGSCAYIIMYILIIFLLYFDDRPSVMLVTFIFLLSNIIFTQISLIFTESFYGYGFFFSTLISMVIAFFRLQKFLENIDYHTFAEQPIFKKTKIGPFTKIYNLITRIEEKKV
jgi:polysaccharide biosynthesis protein PelG